MKLTGAGTGQIGTALNFTLEGGLANDTVGLFYSFGPGYWDGLRPANELSFLLGLPYAGRVWLQTDPQGGWNLPLGLANDTNLIGLRVYFQTFSAGNGELRGSNALELAICR